RVVSFEPEGMKSYNGNYDLYLEAREEERKTLEAKTRNQEVKIKEAKKFIERFRAKATKARQAQSKIKLIKKMEMIKTHRKEQTIRFTFPPVSRSGRVTVAIEGLAKGYNEKTLYKNLNLTVMRGERVGVIGPNGSGKTTLLRMIASEIDPDQGEIKLGHGVTMNYYAQHHSEILDPGKTVIEEVYQIVPHQTISFVRGICGAFLFSGEDVDKAVRILSGGEKARVCLAKILVKPGNLLVMDEPTNHLDLISSEILIDAFTDFNGTLVFVSHNQSFANRLATKIWDIRDGHILEYPGTLYEYYDYQAGLDNNSSTVPKHDTEAVEAHFKESPLKDRDNRKLKRKEKAEKRHHISATLKPIRSKLTQLEERISGLEQRGRELEIILADEATFKDKRNSVPLLKEYSDVKKKIDELMLRWESHQEQLESVKKELGV
ncbi:MAG: ABC-F family ATP-binding cassette domain-containing protein, partial [Deltaproteobacteria bacterium]|nr:ABC-F family ATP-binding cassette domain-containing protein [Deltaproteobacteria bacterium]